MLAEAACDWEHQPQASRPRLGVIRVIPALGGAGMTRPARHAGADVSGLWASSWRASCMWDICPGAAGLPHAAEAIGRVAGLVPLPAGIQGAAAGSMARCRPRAHPCGRVGSGPPFSVGNPNFEMACITTVVIQ